jgi:hypothetical protein
MAFHPFKKLKIGVREAVDSREINTIQYNIGEALDQLLGKDHLDSRIVKNKVLLPGVVNKVEHNLTRDLQGWIVIRNHGSYSIVWDMQDSNPSPHLLLYLMTPVKCTVDLLVF